jgi:predicted enzyme related to lactoylglutathione lyase
MKITEIAFVCYPVDDIPKARAFYEGVLGLKATSVSGDDSWGFIEYEIGPHTLAIGKGAPQFSPGKTGPCVALETDDFDGLVAKLKAAGAVLSGESHSGKTCSMQTVFDPSGNQIMIHRRIPKKS